MEMRIRLAGALWVVICGAGSASCAPAEDWDERIKAVQRLDASAQWVEQAREAEKASHEAYAAKAYKKAVVFDYAACRGYAMHMRYAEALRAAARGQQRSREHGLPLVAALNGYCIAWVNHSLGSFQQAVEAGKVALGYSAQDPKGRTMETRTLMAGAMGRLGQRQEALNQYVLALEEAERIGSPSDIASIRESLGYFWLRAGQLEEAETHLVEAFRIRRLQARQFLTFSYNSMARLRAAQHRDAEGVNLYTQALHSVAHGIRTYILYFQRARCQAALGNLNAAVADIRTALQMMRQLRVNLPFADELRVSAEAQDNVDIYAFAVPLLAQAAEQSKDRRLLVEAFEISQEARADSLRLRLELNDGWLARLPVEYWQKLDQLRRAQVRALATGKEPDQVSRLRQELAELESNTGLDVVLQSPVGGGVPRRMPKGSILVSFHLAEPRSIRWTLDDTGLRLQWIASKRRLKEAMTGFRAAVAKDEIQHRSLGSDLFTMLFDGVPLDGSLLTIVPDDSLFQLPFAALVTPDGRYLLERTAIRLTPTATISSAQKSILNPAWIGFGDPIANAADDRMGGAGKTAAASLQLPRLVGSAEEVRKCARVWRGPADMRFGDQLDFVDVQQRLRTGPEVAHFATHIHQPPDAGMSPVISLGFQRSGEFQVLTDFDVATMRPAPQLVTLSACGSGQGPIAPGAGLLGLTRAWLLAGTKAVLATQWAVLDDDGSLFVDYYQNLQRDKGSSLSANSAQAIAKAQVHMISRAPVSRWSTYFVIGVI